MHAALRRATTVTAQTSKATRYYHGETLLKLSPGSQTASVPSLHAVAPSRRVPRRMSMASLNTQSTKIQSLRTTTTARKASRTIKRTYLVHLRTVSNASWDTVTATRRSQLEIPDSDLTSHRPTEKRLAIMMINTVPAHTMSILPRTTRRRTKVERLQEPTLSTQ